MSKELQKHIQQFFEIQQFLGSGAYGHVWKVIQKSTKKVYALKKVFDAFQNDIDAQRTYREITILHELTNPNIIKLKSVIKSKNQKDLYLLFQHMQTDLHSLVGQNILELPHLLYITYQIFKALKFIHSAQLIHRDLKPSNILINADCQIKLCDFGLVRSLTREQDSTLILTEDVATRWYRSPEMLLGSQNYGPQTDVWSVGCILAELLIGEPIMMGDSNLKQLQKILQLTGLPKNQDINALEISVADNLIKKLRIAKKPFHSYFKGSKFQQHKQLIELISRMLYFNPNKRITVQEVLNHQILSQMRCKRQQIICQKIIIPEIDDNIRLDVADYRKIIYKDIQRRYPEYNPASINLRYLRAHNSLIDRKNQSGSIQRKTCNSLFRPTRINQSIFVKNKHQLLVRPSIYNNENSNYVENQTNFFINQKFLHNKTNSSTKANSYVHKPDKNTKNKFNNLKRQYKPKNQQLMNQLTIQESKQKNSFNYRTFDKYNIKSPKKNTFHNITPYEVLKQYPKNNISNCKIERKVLTRQKKMFYDQQRRLKKQQNIHQFQYE